MKKRYIVYLCVILLVVFGNFIFPPVLPVIQLPGEVVVEWPEGSALRQYFGGGLTNTFIATLITFFLLIIWGISLRAKSRTAQEVPTGSYNFFEMIIELAYGYVEGAAGKWAKAFFPFFMTFILWIIVANWMELIPGVDAIGKWENIPHHKAHLAEIAAEEEGEHLTEEEIHAIEEKYENTGAIRSGIFLVRPEEGQEEEADYTIVPYVRAAATDLNFTLALAIVSVVMTQYFGMKAQGLAYWKKFFVWDGDKIAKNPLAILDSAVGLLELVSEMFKIVSFAFRLLGNIFAGQVLLFVIASLVPVANLLFWHLEFGVGALQAVIFALLTLTFMTGATQSHHADEHH